MTWWMQSESVEVFIKFEQSKACMRHHSEKCVCPANIVPGVWMLLGSYSGLITSKTMNKIARKKDWKRL